MGRYAFCTIGLEIFFVQRWALKERRNGKIRTLEIEMNRKQLSDEAFVSRVHQSYVSKTNYHLIADCIHFFCSFNRSYDFARYMGQGPKEPHGSPVDEYG